MKRLIFITILVYWITYPVVSQLKIEAELRPRTEYRDGFKTLNEESLDPAFFIEQRSRLGLEFRNEKFKVKLSFQDVRLWGGTSQIYKQDNSLFNLNEAWGQYFLSPRSSLKIGRQELDYDNARFLGNLAWAQQSRSHDVFKYEYNDSKSGVTAHIGVAFNQEMVNGSPEPARLFSTFYSGVNNYKTMQYFWLNKVYEAGKISFLGLNNGIQEADSSMNYSQTVGTFWNHSISAFTLITEAYYQFGNDPFGNRLSAYLLAISLTHKIEKHSISIGGDFLSGTKMNATKNTAFTPLFGTNHKFYGLMDYFYVGNGHGNVGLNDFYVKTNWKTGEKSNLIVHVHQFMSGVELVNTEGDAITSSLGQEVDLVYNNGLSKEVNWKLGLSILSATESMETLKAGDHENLNMWAWTMITFKPSFFLKVD